MKVIDALESFVNKQDHKIRSKVRKKAMKNVETNLIFAGRRLNDLDLEEWQHIIAEEEAAIWQKFMKGGIGTVLAIAFFGVP